MAISSMAACATPSPGAGFRSGIEPVLLAAAIPARPGARVLEGGSGAGAALLCLAARVPGVHGLGIEQDPALVALARQNAAANGWPDLRFMAADIASLPALERVRPCLRQSALSRRCRHAIAGRFAPGRQARRRRAAGGLGRRPGTPVAAARHAHLHPAGGVAAARP